MLNGFLRHIFDCDLFVIERGEIFLDPDLELGLIISIRRSSSLSSSIFLGCVEIWWQHGYFFFLHFLFNILGHFSWIQSIVSQSSFIQKTQGPNEIISCTIFAFSLLFFGNLVNTATACWFLKYIWNDHGHVLLMFALSHLDDL